MQINFNKKPGHLHGLMEMAKEELERLEKYSHKIEKADIYYKETHDLLKPIQVEIKLSLPGPQIFAHDSNDTFAKAFSHCVTKLEHQLEKRSAHRHD